MLLTIMYGILILQEQNLHVVEMLESDLEAKKAEISRLMGELQHFQSQVSCLYVHVQRVLLRSYTLSSQNQTVS